MKKADIDNCTFNFDTFEIRKYSRMEGVHDGIPTSIRIPDTMNFIWWDHANDIRVKNGEYKFEAYFVTDQKTKTNQNQSVLSPEKYL